MTSHTLSLSAALKVGWQSLKQHWKFFLGLLAIFLLINIGPALLSELLYTTRAGSALTLGIIIDVAGLVLQMIVSMGLIRLTVTMADGGQPTYSQLWSEVKKFWRFLGSNIVVGLITFLGFLLFIIPGIIWSITYQFAGYLIIDKNQGAIEAIHHSGQITKGYKWKLLGISIVLFLINMVGVLALGIGLLITVPVTMVAYAHLYRQLDKFANPARQPDPVSPPSAQLAHQPPASPPDQTPADAS